MPVHKTCRQFLVSFVDRLEGDDEIVVDVKFDGADVWVITELAEVRPDDPPVNWGDVVNGMYETRRAGS